MRIVAISDTHSRHDQIGELPDGDVLIHAGDVSGRGDLDEVERFGSWFGSQPHRYKIVVAGNHDFCFERQRELARGLLIDCVYLEDSGVEIDGLRIWGSPWQPWFHDWAFNLARGAEIAEKWALIPNDTDVLVTHGPPWGVLDEAPDMDDRSRTIHVGCEELRKAVFDRVRPRTHIFGHIHEGSGIAVVDGVTLVNASICTAGYHATNPPRVVDVD